MGLIPVKEYTSAEEILADAKRRREERFGPMTKPVVMPPRELSRNEKIEKAARVISERRMEIERRNAETARTIIAKVIEIAGVTHEQFHVQSHDRKEIWPRAVAIYTIRTFTTYTLLGIARDVGKTDHTTIINAIKNVDRVVDRYGVEGDTPEKLIAELIKRGPLQAKPRAKKGEKNGQ